MRRIAFLSICIACGAGDFAAKAALENEIIAQFLRDNAAWIATLLVAGLAGLGLVLLLGYLYARHRLRKLLKADTPLTEAQIAEGLVDMFTTPDGVTNPTPQDRQRAALVNAGTWLMRRQATQFYFNVTVTVMGGLIGTATLILLYEQNQKIDLQNERITLQTDANITESVLLEGTRRAALASDMTALFADIRAAVRRKNPRKDAHRCLPDRPRFETSFDCWHIDEQSGAARFHLSAELQARVTSFVQRNTPYRLAISEDAPLSFEEPLRHQFVFQNLSPERGQLFETLLLNRVFTGAYRFWNAQLTGADLARRDLSWARLKRADLAHAKLEESDLKYARFEESDLEAAKLNDADMYNTIFVDAVMDAATLERANLERAILTRASLKGANLGGANLRGASLVSANLRGANLSGVDFTDAMLDDTDFSQVWAWRHLPPRGLARGKKIILCDFDEVNDHLWKKPKDCPDATQLDAD